MKAFEEELFPYKYDLIFKHHARKWPSKFYFILMKLYFIQFKPALVKFAQEMDPNEPVVKSTDAIELMFYLLYTYNLGYYPVPAPPMSVLRTHEDSLNLGSHFTQTKMRNTKPRRKLKDKNQFKDERDRLEWLKARNPNMYEWGKFTPYRKSRLLLEPTTRRTANYSPDVCQGIHMSHSQPSGSRDEEQEDHESPDFETDESQSSESDASECSEEQRHGPAMDRTTIIDAEPQAGTAFAQTSIRFLSTYNRSYPTVSPCEPRQGYIGNLVYPSLSELNQKMVTTRSDNSLLPQKGPQYSTKLRIRDRHGNVIAESNRPPKEGVDPEREQLAWDDSDSVLDPDYWDARVWARTGLEPGKVRKVTAPRRSATRMKFSIRSPDSYTAQQNNEEEG